VLFLAVAALVRALFSQPTLTLALDEIAERLDAELGLKLAVGSIRAEAGSALVEAGPIVVKGSDGEVLFLAELVRAEIEPLKLFERRARLARLEVVKPHVSLRIVDGKLAGVRVPEGGAGADPLVRVDVERFKLTGGSVDVTVIENGKTLVEATLLGIEARMRDHESGTASGEHRLRVTVAGGEVRRPLDATATSPASVDVLPIDSFGGRLSVIGDGLLAPERVALSEVTVAAVGAEVTVAGTIDLSARGELPAFSADVSGHARLEPALALAHLPVPIAGDASFSVHASAKSGAKELAAEGQVDVLGLVVDGLALGNVRARVDATREHIEIPAGAWDLGGTTLVGRAKVALDDTLTAEVSANAKGFSIYDLLTAMGSPGSWADAKIDGAIDVRGTLKPFLLQGAGGGTFTEVRVASRDVRTIKQDSDLVLLTTNPIAADDVAIRVDDEGLLFRGRVDDGLTRGGGLFQIFYDTNRGLVIDAEAEQAAFASIHNRIGSLAFGGAGRGHVHVEGPQSHLLLDAEAEVNAFDLEGFAFGDVTGKIHLDRSVVTFSELVAEKEGTTRYGGVVALDFNERTEPSGPDVGPDAGKVLETPHLSLDLAFGPARAETVRRIVPERYADGVLGFLREDLDIEGPVRGRIVARGAVGDGTFEHMTGEGELSLEEGATLLGQHLTGHTPFRLTHARFFLDGLDAVLAGGPTRLTLDVGRDEGDLAGSFSITDAQLARIDALMDSPRVFAGALFAEGRIDGTSQNPGATGRARVRGAAYGTIPIGDADVSLRHTDRVLTLAGMALSTRGEALIHTQTRSPFVYDASVRISQGALAPLLPKDLLPEGLVVTTGGVVEAKGALKEMRKSAGTMALDTLVVSARGLQLASKKPVPLRFVGSQLSFDGIELHNASGDTIGARGSLSDDAVDVQVHGRGAIGWLPALWPRAQSADGRFALDLTITGDLDSAAMSGQGTLTNGALVLGDPYPPMSDIDALVFFRGSNVVIDRMTMKADGAPLTVQGAVTLDGASPTFYDLEGRATKLKLRVPSYIESVASGRFALKGDAELPTLSGEMKVHSARYTEDINWERVLPDLRRKTSALDSLDTDDEDVRFDLHLIADRGVVVDNNVLDLEAKGDLFLTGTDERPGLKGGLQLLRGNATFRGNSYRLPRGTVDFVDTYRVLPVLDVVAETRVQDYDISAQLTGPAAAPAVSLTSTPDLAEIDIVSLLTFGFTQFDMRDAGGSAGAAGLEVMSAYTGLDQELQRVLPDAVRRSNVLALDELRLTSQFSMRAGANLPAVALGMEVNPGLWGIDGSRLRLQSTLVDATGAGTERRVEWEKRFDNNVRLRLNWKSQDDGSCPSCVNQWGDLGGDVWYRWEF
jgi:TamB, inner membrane protein subunit of TAM complex